MSPATPKKITLAFVAYPRHLLNDDEQIVLERHPHWSFMLGAMVMIALSFGVLIAMLFVAPPFFWIGLICVFFALLGSTGRYLHWRCTDFVVTTDRIVIRQGVLSKQGLEIPLDRVMNISYHQALWERMLGTGDLVVESAGESGHQFFTDVANPSNVQNLIYRQTEAYQDRHNSHGLAASTDQPRQDMSIPEQIEKLAQLQEDGILSMSEFQNKKQELLDRM